MRQFEALLYFVIVVVVFDSTSAQTVKCPKKDFALVDTLGARITTVGKHGRRFPETRPELVSYCREMKKDLKGIESLVKECFEGQTKQFASIVVFSLRNVLKNSCGKKAERRVKELLSMGKCGNALNVPLAKCVDNYINQLQGTLLAEHNKRMPLVCCNYFKLLDCFYSQTRSECADQSESIRDLIRNIFQGVVDVSCGEYTESSDKCDSLAAAPKKPKGAPSYKSFTMPLLQVWASF